ncbi:MAG: DUF2283 domain-containing protein [Nitrospina sp.]|jgi:uncharacterized protein YuzE|nr:DUF2283 domain-containing protein [Nitrospina sp.]
MKQKYYYDEKSDSLFIHLKDGPEERFEEAAPGIHVEFNDKDEMIGIEILKASRFSDRAKKSFHK